MSVENKKSSAVNLFHSMNWLKSASKFHSNMDTKEMNQSNEMKSLKTAQNKDDMNNENFSGTKKKSKNKRSPVGLKTEMKTKDNKTITTNNASETMTKDEKSTANQTVQSAPVPTAWNSNASAAQTLFSKPEPVKAESEREQEDIKRAIKESVSTLQKEEIQRQQLEKNKLKKSVLKDNKDSDEWNQVKHNLPEKMVNDNKMKNDNNNNEGKTNQFVDKLGRVDGYTERHLFMGKGGRNKEQEFLRSHNEYKPQYNNNGTFLQHNNHKKVTQSNESSTQKERLPEKKDFNMQNRNDGKFNNKNEINNREQKKDFHQYRKQEWQGNPHRNQNDNINRKVQHNRNQENANRNQGYNKNYEANSNRSQGYYNNNQGNYKNQTHYNRNREYDNSNRLNQDRKRNEETEIKKEIKPVSNPQNVNSVYKDIKDSSVEVKESTCDNRALNTKNLETPLEQKSEIQTNKLVVESVEVLSTNVDHSNDISSKQKLDNSINSFCTNHQPDLHHSTPNTTASEPTKDLETEFQKVSLCTEPHVVNMVSTYNVTCPAPTLSYQQQRMSNDIPLNYNNTNTLPSIQYVNTNTVGNNVDITAYSQPLPCSNFTPHVTYPNSTYPVNMQYDYHNCYTRNNQGINNQYSANVAINPAAVQNFGIGMMPMVPLNDQHYQSAEFANNAQELNRLQNTVRSLYNQLATAQANLLAAQVKFFQQNQTLQQPTRQDITSIMQNQISVANISAPQPQQINQSLPNHSLNNDYINKYNTNAPVFTMNTNNKINTNFELPKTYKEENKYQSRPINEQSPNYQQQNYSTKDNNQTYPQNHQYINNYQNLSNKNSRPKTNQHYTDQNPTVYNNGRRYQ